MPRERRDDPSREEHGDDCESAGRGEERGRGGAGALDGAVVGGDVRSGARAMNLNAEAGGVTAVGWSPDGKYLAAGRNFVRIMLKERVSINLWDARTGALVRNIPAPFPPVSADNDVAAPARSPQHGHG